MEKLFNSKEILSGYYPQTDGTLVRLSTSPLLSKSEITRIHGFTLGGEEFSYTKRKLDEPYPGIFRIWGLVANISQGTALISLEDGDERGMTSIVRFNPHIGLTVWLKDEPKPLVLRTSIDANSNERW